MYRISRQDTFAQRLEIVRRAPLFATLRQEDLEKVARDFRLKSFDRDEIIFYQGDLSREMYMVATGKVRIFKLSPGGGETSINIISTNDLIGEFAAIDSQPRSAMAKAIVPVTLLAMTHDRFLYHLRYIPELVLGLTQLLAQKVRWTSSYAETIAQYDAAGRLLHILLLYNDLYGSAEEAGKRYVLDLALNQADLASLVGARREWVNRLLRSWTKRGLIEYDNGKITILDLPRAIEERDSRIEANSAIW
jgi:CRP/FNR family transcriptional regulator